MYSRTACIGKMTLFARVDKTQNIFRCIIFLFDFIRNKTIQNEWGIIKKMYLHKLVGTLVWLRFQNCVGVDNNKPYNMSAIKNIIQIKYIVDQKPNFSISSNLSYQSFWYKIYDFLLLSFKNCAHV